MYGEQERLSRLLASLLHTPPLIVIEGDRSVMEGEEVRIARILRSGATVRRRLIDVAELCDYSVHELGNAFLLYKRYSDVGEMPCVTAGELVAYAQSISRPIAAIFQGNTSRNNTDHIHRFLLSLDDRDWQTVKGGVLSGATLSPASRQGLVGLFTETFCGSLRDSRDLVEVCCRNLDTARVILREDQGPVPYLTLQSFVGGKPSESWNVFPGADFAPAGKSAMERDRRLNTSFFADDLPHVVQRLNARTDVEASCRLSSVLLQKPVSVVGSLSSPPQQILRAIARLYNLTLEVKRDSLLLREAPAAGMDITRLGDALPAPMQRTILKRSYEVTVKRLACHLIPELAREKSRTLLFKGLPPLYQLALVADVFQKLGTEVRDNDMRRLDGFLSHLDLLYFHWQRRPGQRPVFKVSREQAGKLVALVEYDVRRDVRRD